MTEAVDRFRQGMDELVQRGEARLLRRQVTRRFGEETAGRLTDLLDELSGPEEIDKVTDALLECATGDEFIERVRMTCARFHRFADRMIPHDFGRSCAPRLWT